MTQNLFKTKPQKWTEHNNIYNPDKQLDNDQVIQMTHNIALANNLQDDSNSSEDYSDVNYFLRQINIEHELNILNIYLKSADFVWAKPIILQLCNGKHWITMGLLPNPNKTEEHFAVKMNSYIPNELKDIGKLEDITYEERKKLMNGQQEELKKQFTNMMVDPDPTENIIKYLKGLQLSIITNLDLKTAIDLSVNQQLANNCGLMTAANSVSILKTYNELKDSKPEIFNDPNTFEGKFKEELEKNVFYEKKQDHKRYVLGKETDLKEGEVVQIIGQAVLEGECTDQDIQEKLNAQLIKKILLEDAIESYNDLDKKELLEKLEDGKLTDDEFNQALTNKGFNLKNYLVQYSQDVNNHHDIVSESWSEMINKAVQSSQGNSIDSIS